MQTDIPQPSREAAEMPAEGQDAVGYLIQEFEVIILRMAREIDTLRSQLAVAEARLSDVTRSGR
jgi:hypothetical protein